MCITAAGSCCVPRPTRRHKLSSTRLSIVVRIDPEAQTWIGTEWVGNEWVGNEGSDGSLVFTFEELSEDSRK